MRGPVLLLAIFLLLACTSHQPTNIYQNRCITTTRIAWQPTIHEIKNDCSPVAIQDTPRSQRQYYITCPQHSYFCYRKAKFICGEYRQLKTEPLAHPGKLLIECQ